MADRVTEAIEGLIASRLQFKDKAKEEIKETISDEVRDEALGNLRQQLRDNSLWWESEQKRLTVKQTTWSKDANGNDVETVDFVVPQRNQDEYDTLYASYMGIVRALNARVAKHERKSQSS